MTLPTDAKERKNIPIVTGCLDYFPDAIAAVAELSKIGNEQHNPGQPLHWAREKSTDHADCIGRHLLERGTIDTDGQRHSAKLAWRALALLQTEIETTRTTTTEPVAMETRHGFTVGERVRTARAGCRSHEGTVRGFRDRYVDVAVDHTGCKSGWLPVNLRKL